MSDDATLHALPAGHVFDGYRLLRMLGAGGFGITYLAEEVVIGRKVAIKEYLPTGFAGREANSFSVRPLSAGAKQQYVWGLERFRQEAATLVNFEHPNIVGVHRYFEANGTAYLVMQYVEGKPLDAILAGSKTLAESEIEEVIGPIMDGLEQVHAAGFMHRDIKPANIYIRKDGRPVLLDFGAARQAFGSETRSITAIVSEGYAPFEQYEAKGDQGAWTDVYALGAVLYRCIAGQRPPAAPERVSARLRNAPDPMPPARVAAKEAYTPRLLDAIDRALGTMRNERPQDVAELRALLKPDRADAPPSRLASTLFDKSTEPPRPAAPSVPVPVAPEPATAKRASKKRVPLLAGIGAVVVAGAVAAFIALTPGKSADPRKAAGPGEPPTTASATPGTPPGAADEAAAERVAAAAADEAAAIVDSAKQAIEKGELERGRDELRLARRRTEDGLRRKPGHAGLERILGAVSVAEADLTQRIAARVKELIETAERESAGPNAAESEKLLGEAERLDPAAATAAREKIKAAREARARAEAEKLREEEARKARAKESEVHLSQARYHITQARDALQRGWLNDARQLLRQSDMQLAKAVEALKAAGPAKEAELSAAFRSARAEIDELTRDITQRIAARLLVLKHEARAAIQANRHDDATKAIDEAATLDPDSADVAALRRDAEAARKRADDARKADEERRRREDADRRRKEDEARRKPAEPPTTPNAPSTSGAVNLAGRTGTLSRLSPQRRAIMRIRLQFGAGGALAASCTTETATGGQEACFGQQSGGGRWSLNGATLCVTAPVINLSGNTCYQVAGSGNQLSLSGPGLLAGAMFLQ